MKIEITSLGQLTHLNTGGEGIVYKCSQYPDKAFKLYKKEVEHEIDLVALEKSVQIFHALPSGERPHFEERTAWPEMIVVENGVAVGFLMPLLKDEMYCEYGAVTETSTITQLREWQFLAYRKHWSNPNISTNLQEPSKDQLLELIIDLSKTVYLMHQHKLVIGDISFRNILWCTDGYLKTVLIDCDGIRHEGLRGPLAAKQTPDWIDFDRQTGSTDRMTDLFKLGLANYRGYFGAGSSYPSDAQPPELPTAADQAVFELSKRAVLSQAKPSASDWVYTLEPILRQMHQEKISGDARAEIKKPVAEVREPRLNTLLPERPVFQKPIIGN
jgi:DNA-binding helix-hairpin-helix protein with protein kinase domain